MRRVALTATTMLILSAAAAAQTFDLVGALAAGKLRAVNRVATPLPDGPPGVHVSETEGPGVIWIEGSTFSEGTIAVDVRGRNVPQRSFLGVAFHRKDDKTYEAVYLRPFNFRSPDPASHHHAVQYISVPDYDWPRLRKDWPEKFEGQVDASVSPTDWVTLRVVVKGGTIQVYAGTAAAPALEVGKLGTLNGGEIGLWVGNNSDGDFANLRITPMK
jgi:hypothetical protein